MAHMSGTLASLTLDTEQGLSHSLGFDEGSGATGMWGPDLSKKEGYGYNGYTEGPGGTFGAIVTYAKSCHVSRELSSRTPKMDKIMRCEGACEHRDPSP